MYSAPDTDSHEQPGADDESSVAQNEICADHSLSDRGFREIQRIARSVSEGRPALVRELGWPEQPATRLVHEFFSRDNTWDKIAALCEKATSATSFRPLLHKALDNLLLDLHRQTDVGAAGRRIKNLLRSDGRFVEAATGGERWALPEFKDDHWNGDEDELEAAASEFDFTRLEYDSESRRSPILPNAEIIELLDLLLGTAGGPVPLGVLVRTIRSRTGLGAAPTFVDLEAVGNIHDEDAFDAGDEVVARAEAEQLLGQFNEQEREALRHRDLSVRELGHALGASKSTANNIRNRIRERLEPYSSGGEDHRVLRHFIELLEDHHGQARSS